MKSFLFSFFIISLIGCSSNKKQQPFAEPSPKQLLNAKTKQCEQKKNKGSKKLKKIISKLKPLKKGSKYSFSFLDAGLKEALIELSMESSTPIVFGENVSGMVSLNINERTFEESLDMIVKTGPYEYKKYDSHYYVGLLDKSENSWEKLSYNFSYSLKYIKPRALKESLPPQFSEFINFNSHKNAVHIMAPRTQFIKILSHINKTDIPRTQIKIQLTIIELSKEGSSFIGKKFQSGTLADYEHSSNDLTIPTLLPQTSYLKFLYTVKALKQQGHAEIKATPTLLTLEHRPAKFQTLNKDLLVTPNRSISQRPEFIESGILFQIVPYIINNDTIRLSIKDSHSSTYDPNTLNLNEHKIDTEVEVKMGDSILLGGMIYNKKERVITKVPVLGDLPLIGGFFKNRRNEKITKEILFSIKPEVHCI